MRRYLSLALLVALLLSAAPAFGGAERECVEFEIFRGARVNTLIRQFMGMADPSSSLSTAGMQLGRMVQLDALQSQIGFGPLGCIFLRVEPSQAEYCSNEFILERGRQMSQEGRGLILLSGKFEEVDGRVFLLTRLEFERVEQEESFRLKAATDDVEYLGELPVTRVSFSPRQFAAEDLESLTDALERPMTLYPEPRAAGNGEELGLDELENFSYSVQRLEQGWMYIVSADGDREGWVEARRFVGARPLRGLLPELSAVQATAIYLQTRIARDRLEPRAYQRHLRTFERLMERFRQDAQSGGDQRALGMLEAMLGVLRLEAPGSESAEAMTQAKESFERSAAALPANGNALVLRDLSRVLYAPEGELSVQAKEVERNLLQLMKLDPKNTTLRANLERFYVQQERLETPLPNRKDVPQLRTKIIDDPKVREKLKKQ